MVTITNVRPSKTAGKTVIEYSQVLKEIDADAGRKPMTAYKSILTEALDNTKIFIGKTYADTNIILVDLKEPREYVDKNGKPAIQTKETVLV